MPGVDGTVGENNSRGTDVVAAVVLIGLVYSSIECLGADVENVLTLFHMVPVREGRDGKRKERRPLIQLSTERHSFTSTHTPGGEYLSALNKYSLEAKATEGLVRRISGLEVTKLSAGLVCPLSPWIHRDTYIGAKKYLVGHQLCKFSHLKR